MADIQRWQDTIELLIEPYWNVNGPKGDKGEGINYLLIEPYWNVNKVLNLAAAGGLELLIEPYWNVNIYSIKQ